MDERLNVRLALTMFTAERNKFRGPGQADAVNAQVDALEDVVYGRHGQAPAADGGADGEVSLPVKGSAHPVGGPRIKSGDDGLGGNDGPKGDGGPKGADGLKDDGPGGGDAGGKDTKDGKAGPKG